jgi:hypothetical protein
LTVRLSSDTVFLIPIGIVGTEIKGYANAMLWQKLISGWQKLVVFGVVLMFV